MHDGVNRFSRRGKAQADKWAAFSKNIHYTFGSFSTIALYNDVKKQVEAFEQSCKCTVNRVFYMAVPPDFFEGCELQSCRGNSRALRTDCRGSISQEAHKPTHSTDVSELGGSGLAFASAYPLTLVGLFLGVKGMPAWMCLLPARGGEGDRCQGCAGPRGRTLSEVQTR